MSYKNLKINSILFLLVPVALLFPFSSGSPASPPLQSLPFLLNATLHGPNPTRTHCLEDDTWMLPKLDGEECVNAVERLYYTDVLRHEKRQFEFLAANTSPSSRILASAYTPRRYTIGRCTVAVVMLVDFPDSQLLPGQPPGPHPPRAKTSFEQLWGAAGRIVLACIRPEGFAGWEVVGRQNAIGVFVWSTGSEIDRAVGGFF